MEPDENDEPIEIDARVGLILNAVAVYKHCAAVALEAIRAFTRELESPAVNELDGVAKRHEYARAFVKTGGVQDVLDVMNMYMDRKDIIDACMKLLSLVLSVGERYLAMSVVRADLVPMLANILKHSTFTAHTASLVQAVGLIRHMADYLPQWARKKAPGLLELLSHLMLQYARHADVISASVTCAAAIVAHAEQDQPLPPNAIKSIVATIKRSQTQTWDFNDQFFYESLRFLVSIIELSSRHENFISDDWVVTMATVLYFPHPSPDYNEDAIETLVGTRFDQITDDGLGVLRMFAAADTSSTNGNRSLGLSADVTDKLQLLSLAVLWRRHAIRILSEGCLPALVRLTSIYESPASLPALAVLHHTLVALHDEAADEIVRAQTVRVLLEVMRNCSTTLSDISLDHALASLEIVFAIEGMVTEFVSLGGLDVVTGIVTNHTKFPLSTIRIAHILAQTHPSTMKSTIVPSELCDALVEACSTYKANHKTQTPFLGALNVITSLASPHSTQLSKQSVKELIRLLRSKFSDLDATVQLIHLCARLLSNPVTRTDLIDQGLLQVISKTVYQQPKLKNSAAVAQILHNIAHELDASRNLSILEALSNLSEQVSTSDMDPFLDSLELCCAVIAALVSTHVLSACSGESKAIRLLAPIIEHASSSQAFRGKSDFNRAGQACMYVLDNLTKCSDIIRVIGNNGDVKIDVLDNVRVMEFASGIVKMVDKMLHFDADDDLIVAAAVNIVGTIITKYPAASTVFVKAGWLSSLCICLEQRMTSRPTTVALLRTTVLLLSYEPKLVAVFFSTGGFQVLVELMQSLLDGGLPWQQEEVTLGMQVLDFMMTFPQPVPLVLARKCCCMLRSFLLASMFFPTTSYRVIRESAQRVIHRVIAASLVEEIKESLVSVVENGAAVVDILDDLYLLDAVLLSGRARDLLRDGKTQRVFAQMAHMFVSIIDLHQNQQVDGCLSELATTVCLGRALLPVDLRDAVVAKVAHLWSERCVDNVAWMFAADMLESEAATFVELLQEGIQRQRADLVGLREQLEAYIYCCSQTQTFDLSSKLVVALTEELARRRTAKPEDQVVLHRFRIDVFHILSNGLLRTRDAVAQVLHPERCASLVEIIMETIKQVCFVGGPMSPYTNNTTIGNAFIPSLLHSTEALIRFCVQQGVIDQVRALIHHPTMTQVIDAITVRPAHCEATAMQHWFSGLLLTINDAHGPILAEKLVALSRDPVGLLAPCAVCFIGDTDYALDWSVFEACLTNACDSLPAMPTPDVLFEKMQEQAATFVRSLSHSAHPDSSNTTLLAAMSFIQQSTAGMALALVRWANGSLTADGAVLVNILSTTVSLQQLQQAIPWKDVSTLLMLLLRVATLIARHGQRGTSADYVISTTEHLLSSTYEDTHVVCEALDLIGVHCFSGFTTSVISQVMTISATLLLRTAQRLAGGARDIEMCQLSAFAFIRNLQGVLVDHWEEIGALRVLSLLQATKASPWLQNALLESLFSLAQGVTYLLEVANVANTVDASVQGRIMVFFSRNASLLRQKPQRVGESEMKGLLLVLEGGISAVTTIPDRASMDALADSKHYLERREVMVATLELLKDLVRVKRCALLCCQLRGMEVLYAIISAYSQQEAIVVTALEVCCYLTSHPENVDRETLFPLLRLLFLLVDSPKGPAYVRLSFLVLDQCTTLTARVFSYSLVQQCRSYIMKWKAQCSTEVVSEEALQTVHRLYLIQQSCPFPVLPQSDEYSDEQRFRPAPSSPISNSSPKFARCWERRFDICDTIARYHSIVQSEEVGSSSKTTGQNTTTIYVDMLSGAKFQEEPPEYTELCSAVEALRIILHDPMLLEDQPDLISRVGPPLCKWVLLHARTTEVVCLAMEALTRMTFLNADEMAELPHVQFSALFSSLALHSSQSLLFTILTSNFCENLSLSSIQTGDARTSQLLELVWTLLTQCKEDYDVTQSCMFALSVLLEPPSIRHTFLAQHQQVLLPLLNGVFLTHSHDVGITRSCLKCVGLIILSDHDRTPAFAAAVGTTTSILIAITRAHMAYSFIVENALTLCARLQVLYREEACPPMTELDAVGLWVSCLVVNMHDDLTLRPCLHLLQALMSSSLNAYGGVTQRLVQARADVVLSWVAPCKVDNPQVSSIVVELLMKLAEVQDDHANLQSASQQTTAMEEIKNRVLHQLLSVEVMQTLFMLLSCHADGSNPSFLGLLLELIYDLTRLEDARELVEQIHGMRHLRTVIDSAWVKHHADSLADNQLQVVESALDCLVNIACSNRTLHGWSHLMLWLLELAGDLQALNVPTASHCVEKILGILTRLAVNREIGSELTMHGAHLVLQLLTYNEDDRFLELAILTLMWQLCHDPTKTPTLIMFDAIAITLECISFHIDDEERLFCCIRFLGIVASAGGDCRAAVKDDEVLRVLRVVIEKHHNSGRICKLARELLAQLDDRLAKKASRRLMGLNGLDGGASSDEDEENDDDDDLEGANTSKSAPSALVKADSKTAMQLEEEQHVSVLRAGLAFWVKRGGGSKSSDKKDAKEKYFITLSDDRQYLIFRYANDHVHGVERIFLSQVEVLSHAEAGVKHAPASSSKAILGTVLGGKPSKSFLPSFARTTQTDCVLFLLVKKETWTLEAPSAYDRVAWEHGLHWLLRQLAPQQSQSQLRPTSPTC